MKTTRVYQVYASTRGVSSHCNSQKREAETLLPTEAEKPDSDATSPKFSHGGNVEGPVTKVLKSDISYNSLRSEPAVEISTDTEVEVMQEFMNNAGEDEEKLSESDDNDENFNYMQIRMKNMKQNEEFLASIGINKAKEEMKQVLSVTKSTTTVSVSQSQRGLRVKKEPLEPLPRRKSLRLSRLDPDGTPLPQPDPVTVPQEVVQERFLLEDVPRPGSLKLKDCVYPSKKKSEECLNQFCSFLDKSSKMIKTDPSKCQDNFIDVLGKVSLTEEHVAKVVPGRVFSLSWHPSTDVLIAAAGDKYGHIGLWNVLATEKEGSDIVTAFKPHIKPVTQLSFSLSDKLKLYSSSYDATLRCLDFQKCVFYEIFSVPPKENLRQFSFVDPNIMLVAHHSGLVSVVDTRTATNSAEHSYLVSKKSVHTIHVNPTSPHHFITAGADSDFNLWDLRTMKKEKSPMPLFTLTHDLPAVSSAYFSPNGQQVLSCFTDNIILLLSVENTTSMDLHKIIPHCNRMGKHMTKFRPTWHPTMDNIFISGSLRHQIEIFDSITGSHVCALGSLNLKTVCSLNEFHPGKPSTIVGANSTGQLHVFM